MPFASLPDVKIHYELAGAESFPVLAFCNSLGTTLEMWDGQLEAFSRYFRILRYDTRGHGQSACTPGPYKIEQLSGDFIRLLDVLGLDRVSFCGLSMGGSTGMFLGATASTRFHKLVLCNTVPKFGTPDLWNTRIQNVQRGGMKAIANAVVERWFTPDFRSSHSADVQKVLDMLENANPQGYIACCAAVRDADLKHLLKDISVPSLVVAGTVDPAAPPAEGRALSQSISGAAYLELAASHLSNIEAREEFNRQVLPFLLA